MNADNIVDDANVTSDFPDVSLENTLNNEITFDEIKKAISKLKNGKAAGLDNVTNDYIKGSCSELLPVYHMLFNTVLDSGVLPTSWLNGYIIPLYKNKGDTANPENYRPITILSCLGKVFTAILNERLTSYLETNNRKPSRI